MSSKRTTGLLHTRLLATTSIWPLAGAPKRGNRDPKRSSLESLQAYARADRKR